MDEKQPCGEEKKAKLNVPGCDFLSVFSHERTFISWPKSGFTTKVTP